MLESIVRFVHVLRRAGIPVGTDQVLAALRAVALCGVERREDVYWCLAALFVSRREHFDVFGQAFDLYWRTRASIPAAADDLVRDPDALEHEDGILRRVMEALAAELPESDELPVAMREHETIALAPAASERLQKKDFAAMSADEMEEVKRTMANLRLPIPEMRTRRRKPAPRGPHVDTRATLRATLRGARELMLLRRSSTRTRHCPLVVLCDISGSMQSYTRMFLHFLHAVTNDRDRVHVFLFGTRLTNVTRQLRHRDVDKALRGVTGAVEDWSGGTRIASSLGEFNLRWSRRVLGQNAALLLITDGLDRDEDGSLALQAQRLRKSCRRILWLNPLLRFAGFEPRAAGIRALLPCVDRFLPAHNVTSLRQLGEVLGSRARPPATPSLSPDSIRAAVAASGGI
ncbi:MAG: VWA domain-containing protein [Betaproteobacteria bacterium]|nr:VWA domain-containing protein [Betaproteobacteria bacterium]